MPTHRPATYAAAQARPGEALSLPRDARVAADSLRPEEVSPTPHLKDEVNKTDPANVLCPGKAAEEGAIAAAKHGTAGLAPHFDQRLAADCRYISAFKKLSDRPSISFGMRTGRTAPESGAIDYAGHSRLIVWGRATITAINARHSQSRTAVSTASLSTTHLSTWADTDAELVP
jgi:hypothetical protein